MKRKIVQMYKILLTGILCFQALCSQAQSEERLYIKNQHVMDSIIAQIDEKYKDSDVTPKESFKAAIRESFDNYWKDKKVKTKLKVSEFIGLIEQKKALVKVCDSLQILVPKAEQQDGVNLEEQLKNAEEEAKQEESKLQEKQDELTALQRQLEEDQKKTKSDNSIVALLSGIEQDIKAASSKCDGSLKVTNDDLELMKRASEEFKKNEDDLQTFASSPYNTLEGQVKKIDELLPLFGAIHEAIQQMGEKRYDEKTNVELINRIKTPKATISADQKRERDGIIAALVNQKNAFRNINAIMDDIRESPDINVDDVIQIAHGRMDKGLIEEVDGKTMYNRYYTVFNRVLNDIRKMKPNEMKKGELEKKLNELKNQL